ncbi:hypothetical protein MAR_021397 [Mya arenaria]|uniref:WAP domain-containing protein n=1 Tax=Mya arenaria TaxID=6604 RepID=A0ABY7E7Q8_MYAAR|nr:hypothetical protein MAR_021397 [Mya arenaria]
MCYKAVKLSVTLALLAVVVHSQSDIVKIPNCAATLCAFPDCPPGQSPYTPKGSCCQLCRPDIISPPDICALVRCAQPICLDGEESWTPPKECCPTCRSKKVCVQDGKTYLDGETFKKECNRCRCSNGAALCTKMGCLGCRYNGKWYKEGQKFKDNCNTCTCRRGSVSCTEKACSDKPGRCPSPWPFGSSCTQMCSSDFDCKGKMKCCGDGCSRMCRLPVGSVGGGCKQYGRVYSEGKKINLKCDFVLLQTSFPRLSLHLYLIIDK